MYSLSFSLDLGEVGLSLKASLVAAGAVHATFRNVTTTFYADGQGGYEFLSSAIPDGFRGVILFHTGSIAASPSNDLTTIVIKSRGSINPQDSEYPNEIPKIPRLGETFKHRNIVTEEEASVIIEA